jgi:hypothetical protein
MTDTVPAADVLSPFEGSPVTRVGIEMPSAAGGLREAMKFEPVELHKGDRVFIVTECLVRDVKFKPIDKEDLAASPWQRVHVLDVEKAALVDGSVVAEHLAEQARRIQRAKEKAEGIEPLAANGVSADDWGGNAGPLDDPVDPEAGKVIEGAFGAPPENGDEWETPPPPAADDVEPPAEAEKPKTRKRS